MRPDWLSRIEMLGTTAVVLLVGSMMIWHEAVERDRRLAFTIGSAVLLYVLALALFARRSAPARIAWWPFALAGLATGAVAELINAKFLVTREMFVAVATGVVIGTAHWAALRVWVRLTERRAV
jgi:predicted neutral ceramidase superfamily lipid hydrolase